MPVPHSCYSVQLCPNLLAWIVVPSASCVTIICLSLSVNAVAGMLARGRQPPSGAVEYIVRMCLIKC